MERIVTCAALSALVAGRGETALLDVRRQPAFDVDARLIPGAVWSDPEQVGAWAAGLRQDQPVVVYCVHGHEVSRGVVDRLRARRRRGLARGRHRGLEGRRRAGRRGAGGRRMMKWVTRARPVIDRIACPWLIARFIDKGAEFLFVAPDQVQAVAGETGAIPFDVPGVELSHVGEGCSFDAFLAKYRLEEPALHELARIVRGADTQRLDLTPQSAGLLAISLGLRSSFEDDLEVLRHGFVLYDALYRWCRELKGETHSWPPKMSA